MITFTVEIGDANPLANSYASLVHGSDYHAQRLYSEAWDESGPTDQQKALMMATGLIDAHWVFQGTRATEDQALAWPRAYVANRERTQAAIFDGTNLLAGLAAYGGGIYTPVLPSDYIPPRLIAATCEMARLLIEGNRTAENPAKGLNSISLGGGAISLDFNPEDRRALFSDEVTALLSLYAHKAGQSNFRRVVRT